MKRSLSQACQWYTRAIRAPLVAGETGEERQKEHPARTVVRRISRPEKIPEGSVGPLLQQQDGVEGARHFGLEAREALRAGGERLLREAQALLPFPQGEGSRGERRQVARQVGGRSRELVPESREAGGQVGLDVKELGSVLQDSACRIGS